MSSEDREGDFDEGFARTTVLPQLGDADRPGTELAASIRNVPRAEGIATTCCEV